MGTKNSDRLSHLMEEEDDDSSNFRDNVNKYLYHWPLFIIGLIITISGAFFYFQIAHPIYEVKATLLIKDKTRSPQEKSTLDELDISNSPKLAESEIEVLNSRNLVTKVVKDLGLWITYQTKNGLRKDDLYQDRPITFKLLDSTAPLTGQIFNMKIKDKNSFFLITSDGGLREFSFENFLKNSFGTWKIEPTNNLNKFIGKEITVIINDPNTVAQEYQKAIEATLINKLAPAIGLTLNDRVQQRGKDILNDLIRNYNINNIAEKNHITQNTLDFINKRIGSIADELNSSEKALENYRSSKGVTSISLQSKAYLDNIKDNDDKLNSARVQLDIIENIETDLNTSQNVGNASAALGVNYPSLNSLIEKLSILQLQRDKLLATTPEKNPAFDQIDRQVKSAKADIRENIQNIKTSLKLTIDKFQSVDSKFQSSIRDIPGQERELIDKTRQKDIKENLYTYLLQKREEVSMSYASTLPDAQIVDYAYSNVSGSKKSIVYGVAFLLGLILPIAFISTRNRISNRITTNKEIEEAIDEPLFGELSYAKSSKALVVNDKDNIVIGEEFRTLRTNINFLKGKKDNGMVLLLTSSISNEGKSFISSNLGLVFATSGKKTIVLEMDLRRPNVLGFFNVSSSHPGISDYLTGHASKEKIIQKSAAHMLVDVVGSGSPHDEPSELLGLEELDTLINWLKVNYDYVIIDSPPINLVTDAKILSRFSDVTLYIVRQAYTYKSLLPFISALIKHKKLPEMKFILNAVQKGRYGYGYNYGDEYYRAIGNKKSMKLLGLYDLFKRF